MNFKRLSESYFSGTQRERDQSKIEYKSLSGLMIAAGTSSRQTTFTAKGNGELEFFRRGDFMERADAFPGKWRAQCEPKELGKIWETLGEIDQSSFPERIADPGDTITTISGFYPDRVASLSWGPPDHSKNAPGKGLKIAMAPLMNRAAEGEPDWAVVMRFAGITTVSDGLDIRVEFENPGRQPIGIALASQDVKGGFAFRVALDRDVPPGVTPLPVEWTWHKLVFPNQDADMLWILNPSKPVILNLHSDLKLEGRKRYLGKVQYEQVHYLDFLAGCPILSGTCFTDGFEIQA